MACLGLHACALYRTVLRTGSALFLGDVKRLRAVGGDRSTAGSCRPSSSVECQPPLVPHQQSSVKR